MLLLLFIIINLFTMENEKLELVRVKEYTYTEEGYMKSKFTSDENRELQGKVLYFHNEAGNKIRTEKFTANDEPLLKYVYEFDENDRKIKSTKTDIAKNHVSSKVYSYLENGKIAYFDNYMQDRLVKRTSSTYDSEGRTIETINTKADGQLISSYKYKYEFDDKGRTVKKETLSGDDVLIRFVSYEFNEKGFKVSSTTHYCSGNRRDRKIIYLYNSEGVKTGSETYAYIK